MKTRVGREEDYLGPGIEKSKSRRSDGGGCGREAERGVYVEGQESLYCEFSIINSVKTLEQFSIPALTFSCSLSLTLGKILDKNRSG